MLRSAPMMHQERHHMSPLNDEERQYLESVERAFRDAEARTSVQLLHTADLRQDRRDTTSAEQRLRMIAASIELLRLHVEFMRERIELEEE